MPTSPALKHYQALARVKHAAKVIFAAMAMNFVLVVPVPKAAAASIIAKVSLNEQRMRVYVDGQRKFTWRVSTGKKGWETPPKRYTPFALTPYYYSRQWRMKLPYLVSISDDGIAVHGTTITSRLGSRASHGCIRLSIPNAKKFYQLIEKHGMWNTEVVVSQR